ncbi:MAG: hypothetical protein HOH24_08370 [Chromatiales bacterium]|jgi:hypothetical protein|nr:hypothetical protein [Chromatiales bacterium]
MRITDHRYNGEIERFNLAVRMIGHEARTGTIRKCTGFTEDRIRKIYGSYFKSNADNVIKRRRGKSPTQVSIFINTNKHQFESTVLACLFVMCGVVAFDTKGMPSTTCGLDKVGVGQRLCEAFERYRQLHPNPNFTFEKAWGLFNALTQANELILSNCESCNGKYIHDRYALNYHFCASCELLDAAVRM